jgi:hypothetical protein
LRTNRKASEEGGAHAAADVQCTHGGGDEVDGRAPAVLAWLAGMVPRPQREAGKLREREGLAAMVEDVDEDEDAGVGLDTRDCWSLASGLQGQESNTTTRARARYPDVHACTHRTIGGDGSEHETNLGEHEKGLELTQNAGAWSEKKEEDRMLRNHRRRTVTGG